MYSYLINTYLTFYNEPLEFFLIFFFSSSVELYAQTMFLKNKYHSKLTFLRFTAIPFLANNIWSILNSNKNGKVTQVERVINYCSSHNAHSNRFHLEWKEVTVRSPFLTKDIIPILSICSSLVRAACSPDLPSFGVVNGLYSTWKSVRSGLLEGPVPFNFCVSDWEEASECVLIRLADDIRLGGWKSTLSRT